MQEVQASFLEAQPTETDIRDVVIDGHNAVVLYCPFRLGYVCRWSNKYGWWVWVGLGVGVYPSREAAISAARKAIAATGGR